MGTHNIYDHSRPRKADLSPLDGRAKYAVCYLIVGIHIQFCLCTRVSMVSSSPLAYITRVRNITFLTVPVCYLPYTLCIWIIV